MSLAAAATVKSPPPRTPPATLPGFEGLRRTYDEFTGRWLVHVMPGEYYVTRNDETLCTVLGSCISVCISVPTLGLGGMNHFLLPGDDGAVHGEVMRYGSYALERLINEFVKYGAYRERLEIKLFGGGRVINGNLDVGKSNIDYVHRYLKNEQLTIAAESLGGTIARKVQYHPLTGKAVMTEVPMTESVRVEQSAKDKAAALKQQALAPSKVILF